MHEYAHLPLLLSETPGNDSFSTLFKISLHLRSVAENDRLHYHCFICLRAHFLSECILNANEKIKVSNLIFMRGIQLEL